MNNVIFNPAPPHRRSYGRFRTERFAFVACLAAALTPALAQDSTTPAPLHWQPLCEPGSGGAMVDLAVDPTDSKHLLVSGDMLGIANSTDGGNTWQSTFGTKSWECGSFTWDPDDHNTLWVGLACGPYVSHDGGKNWLEKRAGMPPLRGIGHAAPIERILIDPANHKRLIAFAGSRRHWDAGPDPQQGVIWESLDQGENWKPIGTLTKTGFVTGSEIPKGAGVNLWYADWAAGSSTTLIGVADDLGLVQSTDGARTWQPVTINKKYRGNIGGITLSPKDPNTLWVAVDSIDPPAGEKNRIPGSVFKSTDGGKTFTEHSDGFLTLAGSDWNFTSHFNALSVTPSDPNILYVSDGAWNRGIIYKSVDAGEHWTPVAAKYNQEQDNSQLSRLKVAIPNTAYYGGLAMNWTAVDPHNADNAYIIGQEFIIHTHDGGKTWDDATATAAHKNGDRTYWRGNGYSGLCSRNFRFNPYKPGQSILQGMDSSRAWVSDDNLTSWYYALATPNPWFGGWDSTFSKDGHIYWTSGQGGFWGIGRSKDGGKTWDLLGNADHGLPEIKNWGGHEAYGILVHPEHPNLVWTVIEDSLYSSTDGGDHFTHQQLGEGLNTIALDPTNHDRFYITGSRNCFVTQDAGKTFTPIGGPKGANRALVDALGHLYVVSPESARGGLYRYTPSNGGARGTWERLHDDGRIKDVAVDPRDPNRLMVCTNQNPYLDVPSSTGIWISADAGKTWLQSNDGVVMTRGWAIAFDPFSDQIVYGSFGRGFFKSTWPRDYKPVGTDSYSPTARIKAADTEFCDVDEFDLTPFRKLTLRNGDMADGKNLPEGWEGAWGDSANTRDTTIFHSAPASLCVATKPDGGTGQAFQVLDCSPNTHVHVTGWVKSQGKVKVNVALQSFDQNYTSNHFLQAKFIQDDTDWSHFETDLTLPGDAAHVNVLLLVEGQGKAWLDDVTLKTVLPPPPNPITLVNPDFSVPGSSEAKAWTNLWGDVKAVRDTTTFHSAPAALRVATTKPTGTGQCSQMLDVTPGSTLTLSGWTKTQGTAKVNFAVQYCDDAWHPFQFEQIYFAQNDSDWTRGEKEITIPANTAHLAILLLVEGNGKAWLDDVAITGKNVKVFTDPPAGK